MHPAPASHVLAVTCAEPRPAAEALLDKLHLHTDAWDLAADLANGIAILTVIDTRSAEAYRAGHIPGAINLPHRDMTPERLAAFDPAQVYVSYCDGIGCNASTKGAWRLASHGLRVKELIGGLDWWRRDGHPVAIGDSPGNWAQASSSNGTVADTPENCCGCN